MAGPFCHQQRHRIADRDQRRSQQDRWFGGDHAIGELNPDLRVALVVIEDEMHGLALNAAGLVDHWLGELHRLLLRLAEERGAAG